MMPTHWDTVETETFSAGTFSGSIFDGNGGSDHTITTRGPSKVGVYSLRIRDNSSSSIATTKPIGVAEYKSVVLSFYFQSRRVGNGQYFVVRYSTDDGGSWTDLQTIRYGDAVFTSNDVWILAELPAINVQNVAEVKFQIETEFSSNRERIHIDDIVLKGLFA